MKKCNLCHSVVNDKDECHICHNTLTYEPECHLAINKFVLSEVLIAAIICALTSLAVSIFQGGLKKAITWKYSETYAPFKISIWKYLLGAISVLFFIFA